MKQVRLKLVDLLNRHGKTFETCKGCEICTEIKQLRKQLERDPAEKYKQILDKGEDMTINDITFLLDNQVQKKTIWRASGLPQHEFEQVLKDLGFSKWRDEKVALNISVDEFVQLHHIEGKTFGEIADLKGLKKNALSNWKWLNKEKINAILNDSQPDTAEETPTDTQHTTEDRTAEYEALIKQLKAQLNHKENHIEQLKTKIEKYEHINDACDDVESELTSVQENYGQLQKDFDRLRKQYMELDEENQALKYFAKKYLAV